MSSDPSRGERCSAANEVFYSVGREEGMGRLADISISGALLEQTTSKPAADAELLLHVLRDGGSPVDLAAQVVRHNANGFAVKFREFTPALAELLEEMKKAKD